MFFEEDHSQINESYFFKDNLKCLFYIRILLLLVSQFVWWCQISEQSEVDFLLIVTNFQYLTFWGVWSINLYFISAVLDMIFYFKNNQIEYQNRYWKIQHSLFHFAFSTSFAIVLMFWVADYPDLPQEDTSNKWFMFNQIIQHGLLFICINIDFLLNNIRFGWKHLKLVYLISLIYMIDNICVTFIYEPPYDIVDWVSLMSYVAVFAVFILIGFYFFVAKLVYEKYKLPKIHLILEEQDQAQEQNYQVFKQI